MARTLKDFLGIHRGETAWIFGKGPSLDRFDMTNAGPLRCAINETVMAVPDCRYCFANDPVRPWRHVYRPNHVLFSPARTIQDAFLDPATAPEFVSYKDETDETRLIWAPKRMIEEGLAILPGTINSAIQILFVMGISRIICVGIDGGGDLARSQQWISHHPNSHAPAYDKIRRAFIRTASLLRIELEFYGSLPPSVSVPQSITQPAGRFTTLPTGMCYIEITANTFIAGAPVRSGSIISVTPEIATILIRNNRARRYIASPAPAPIETAEAIPGPVEIADAELPKIRRHVFAK